MNNSPTSKSCGESECNSHEHSSQPESCCDGGLNSQKCNTANHADGISSRVGGTANQESGSTFCSSSTSSNAIPELSLPRERRRSKPWEDAPLESRLVEGAGGLREESLTNEASTQQVTKAKVVSRDYRDEPANQSIFNQQTFNPSDKARRSPKKGSRIPRRWDRLVRLLGESGVQKLINSHVTVFGLGGVGSYAVEALARSAVGRLTIVDFDDVCVTNVNRQIQAFPATVGQSKSDLLAQRIATINPNAFVDPVQAFYEPKTSEALLRPRPDFVVDAIDNVTAKLHLLEKCMREGVPVVSIAGAGARLDPTMIRVEDLSKTQNDPLAKVMRKEFTRRGFDLTKEIGLPVVHSLEEPMLPEVPSWDADGFRCICPHAEDSPHACEKRRMIYGTATFITAAFGMAASSVVVRELTANQV